MKEKKLRQQLADKLEAVLSEGGIRQLFCGDRQPESSIRERCIFCNNDRLAVPIKGTHEMTLPVSGHNVDIAPTRQDATYMPAGTWNFPHWIDPAEVIVLEFLQTGFKYHYVINEEAMDLPTLHKNAQRGHVLWADTNCPETVRLLHSITDNDLHDLRTTTIANAVIQSCIISFRNSPIKQIGKSQQTFQKICDYLEDTFTSDIIRDDVAAIFDISPSHLSSLFKLHAKTTYSKYITRLRIERACQLLNNSKMILDEIAFNCGFNQTGYFCQVFKKSTGMTPSEYKKLSRK